MRWFCGIYFHSCHGFLNVLCVVMRGNNVSLFLSLSGRQDTIITGKLLLLLLLFSGLLVLAR